MTYLSGNRIVPPPGVVLLCGVEVLNRLSYFGTRGLLVLFLSAGLGVGGFGWDVAATLRIYGQFVAVYLATPLLGGFLADRWIGHVRSTRIGTWAMAAGYLTLFASIVLPGLDGLVAEKSLQAVATVAAVPLGLTALAAGQADAIARAAGPAAASAIDLYSAVTALFYGGLALIVIGNGLYQSSAMAVLSRHYAGNEAQRDNGFTWQYMAASLGAVAGVLIVGTLGEVVGWPLGFAAAALAMLLGAILFMALQRRLLMPTAHLKILAEPADQHPDPRDPAPSRLRLVVLVVLVLFALVYTIGYEQFMGLVAIYARDSTDRLVLGFQVPATWLPQTVSLFAVLLGGPYVLAMAVLTRRNLGLSVPEKFALGFALTALAFLVMLGAIQAQGPAGSSIWWLVLAYGLLTIGELALWPVGYSAVARLAPARHSALSLGLWLLMGASAGSWLAGEAGAAITGVGLSTGFAIMAAVMGLAAVILLLGQGLLIRFAADGSFGGRLGQSIAQPRTDMKQETTA